MSIEHNTPDDAIPVNGKEQVMEMFKAADEDLKHSILSGIQKKNPNLYYALKRTFVKFEDLVKLEMEEFQVLLRNIPKARLMVALRLASTSFRRKVYQCVSDRQIEEIENYLFHGAKEPVSYVKNEQLEIVKIAERLHQSGRIILNPTRTDIWI